MKKKLLVIKKASLVTADSTLSFSPEVKWQLAQFQCPQNELTLESNQFFSPIFQMLIITFFFL